MLPKTLRRFLLMQEHGFLLEIRQWGIGNGEKYIDIKLNITANILSILATDANNATNVSDVTVPIISINTVKLSNNIMRFNTGNNVLLGVFYWFAIGIK